MFDKNKENDKEEDTYPPVIAKKATKLALKNNKTKKTSFNQTTPEGYSTSDSDSTIDDEYKDSSFLNSGFCVISNFPK